MLRFIFLTSSALHSSFYILTVLGSQISEFSPTVLVALGLVTIPSLPIFISASSSPACWLRVLIGAIVWQSTLILLFCTSASFDLLIPCKQSGILGNSKGE